jgi:hypothetical protein
VNALLRTTFGFERPLRTIENGSYGLMRLVISTHDINERLKEPDCLFGSPWPIGWDTWCTWDTRVGLGAREQ